MSGLSRKQAASRERTLLAAVLLSMWAPLATGVAVAMSNSTTQLADMIRRSVELLALVVSLLVFRYLDRHPEADWRRRASLERAAGLSVAAALCVSGAVMLALAISRGRAFQPGGNVYPGLAIASLGLLTNGWFWRRYTMLTREHHDPVVASQQPLYRAKTLVDLCVLVALGAVAFAPGQPMTRVVDFWGSLAVAAYLLVSGVRTALGQGGLRALMLRCSEPSGEVPPGPGGDNSRHSAQTDACVAEEVAGKQRGAH